MQHMVGAGAFEYRSNPGTVVRRVAGEIEHDRHTQLKQPDSKGSQGGFQPL
jgi:hypothetical protein